MPVRRGPTTVSSFAHQIMMEHLHVLVRLALSSMLMDSLAVVRYSQDCIYLMSVSTKQMHIIVASQIRSDVNECANNNGGCDGACMNIPGSFECSCSSGFQLGGDRMACVGKRPFAQVAVCSLTSRL